MFLRISPGCFYNKKSMRAESKTINEKMLQYYVELKQMTEILKIDRKNTGHCFTLFIFVVYIYIYLFYIVGILWTAKEEFHCTEEHVFLPCM